MSETTAYLIPKNHFEIGDLSLKIETFFKQRNYINGYYDDDNGWFAAGDDAYLLFTDGSESDIHTFEYLEIHDTQNKRLLPEGVSEPVKCSNCFIDIQEDVNDLLFNTTEKEYDEKIEMDIAALELTCLKCGKDNKLSELIYSEKIVFTNQFVCFVSIMEDLNPKMLEEIERYLGSKIEIIYGSI